MTSIIQIYPILPIMSLKMTLFIAIKLNKTHKVTLPVKQAFLDDIAYKKSRKAIVPKKKVKPV